eukprot:COSAG01_NODE_7472_length_3197_cov_2.792770_3_plen_51_part_00
MRVLDSAGGALATPTMRLAAQVTAAALSRAAELVAPPLPPSSLSGAERTG